MDAQKEAFSRWKEAGYAKVAAAEEDGRTPPSVPATTSRPEASHSVIQPNTSNAAAAPKPRTKAKQMYAQFLKGECDDDKCPMTHSRTVRESLVGATITSCPPKPRTKG